MLCVCIAAMQPELHSSYKSHYMHRGAQTEENPQREGIVVLGRLSHYRWSYKRGRDVILTPIPWARVTREVSAWLQEWERMDIKQLWRSLTSSHNQAEA